MSDFGWDYPPGVSGNEPQITGEWPCVECGATLPEEADCPLCGEPMGWDDTRQGEWVCPDPECRTYCPGDRCPGGCR